MDESESYFRVAKTVTNNRAGALVVGGGSCSKGHRFKTQHRILDGHFSHIFVVKL